MADSNVRDNRFKSVVSTFQFSFPLNTANGLDIATIKYHSVLLGN